MEFTTRELREIVGRAAAIPERLLPGFEVGQLSINDRTVERRLARWREVVVKDQPDRFSRRLARAGLDETGAARMLGPLCLGEGFSLPDWARSLNGLIRFVAEADQTGAQRAPAVDQGRETSVAQGPLPSETDPIPFADVLEPFVAYARERLLERRATGPDVCSAPALAAFEQALLERLCHLCAPVLQHEFSLFRALRRSRLQQIAEAARAPAASALYQEFIAQLRAGGLLALLREYAVMARLAATTIGFWVDAVGEFLERLASDRPRLGEVFHDGHDPGPVVAARPFLSDLHHDGRAVIAVRFASGLQLVYKPRSMAPERAFFELTAWINGLQEGLDAQSPRVVDRGGYGWMEYVENRSCGDDEAVRRYYQRAGMLLCLVHVLKGNDCHFENVIACGEHPVLIDLETLLYPLAPPLEATDNAPMSAAVDRLRNSVLSTGLLPSWEVAPDGQFVDSGGLSGAGEQPTSYRIPRWHHVNTDRMVLRFEETRLVTSENAPRLDDSVLDPKPYREEIEEGFSTMYRLLTKVRPALLAPAGPLEAFRGVRGRWVFRDTRIYGLLLLKLLRPEFLRSGADRSIEIEALGRVLLTPDFRAQFWELYLAEHDALFRGDIPHFGTIADSDSLITGSSRLDRFFATAGLKLARERLQNLSEADLRRQASFIRMALYSRYSRFAGRFDRGGEVRDEEIVAIDRAVDLPRPAELVEGARRIAEELRSQAIYTDDGSADWIGLNYITAAQREAIRTIGCGLYDGSGGVALFLAALEKVTGGSGFRDLALASLASLRATLESPAQRIRLGRDIGLGSASGLGGVVYCLTKVGLLLDQPALLEAAEGAAALIEPEMIGADDRFDVLGGSAGAILGLLSLHRARPADGLLERAILCGSHLLDCRVSSPAGPRAWRTLETDQLLTGFSHGAAGIAYSLLRLYAETGRAPLIDAAREALEFERSRFSPAQKNWATAASLTDGRAEPYYFARWCYGAPGIALARLAALPVLDEDAVRQDIDVALETTQQTGLGAMDGLCCGNLGRVEILQVAAARLGQERFSRVAQETAAAVVHRARHSGRFSLFENMPEGITQPGFFQGMSGIGYGLLRLASPGQLPCVLAWE